MDKNRLRRIREKTFREEQSCSGCKTGNLFDNGETYFVMLRGLRNSSEKVKNRNFGDNNGLSEGCDYFLEILRVD